MVAMAEGGEILEGFLCPVCLKDFGTAIQLHSHFQDEHNEEQDVLRSLKDLIGKAKKKILKQDGPDTFSHAPVYSSSNASRSAGYSTWNWEPQELGASRSHTEHFHRSRNARMERYAAETNKLLIRLDKLLVDMPQDTAKRKAHEQNIVPWVNDADVRLCPNCAKPFHLARRKHHCRLCGGIMCHDCSEFLTVSIARKMINPAFGHKQSASTQQIVSPSSVSPTRSVLSSLRRSGSNSSLNSVLSVVDTVTGEPQIRLCVHCKKLLDHRKELTDSRTMKPIITQFYERLQNYLNEANKLSVQYCKMSDSLNCGESEYHLSDAQTLRVKLLKLAESIDSLSKSIAVLGTKDTENPPRGRALQLQHMIRVSATSYLKDELITLPSLPSEAELKALQERRRQELQARIDQEKQSALEAQQRAVLAEMRRKRDSPRKDASPSLGYHRQSEQVLVDAGWGPEAMQTFDMDDPMVQQMNIIRNYIKQAREAHKYDEVSTLEANLKELQDEYYKQQQSV